MSNKPDRFVIVQECGAGNDTSGVNWLETHVCDPSTTLAELWAWRENLPSGCSGRLIVTRERPDKEKVPF